MNGIGKVQTGYDLYWYGDVVPSHVEVKWSESMQKLVEHSIGMVERS